MTDATNKERQQRLRDRRKLGLEPVIVRGVSYSVPPKLAERIERLCQAQEAKEQAEPSGRPRKAPED